MDSHPTPILFQGLTLPSNSSIRLPSTSSISSAANTVVIHLARSALSSHSAVPTISKPITPSYNVTAQKRPIRVVRRGKLHLHIEPHPLIQTRQKQQEVQEVLRIIKDLHAWSTEPDIGPDACREREGIFKSFSDWLNSTEKTLRYLHINWSMIPPVFYEKYVQDHVAALRVECPPHNAPKRGLLELTGLENLKNLKVFKISGAGIKEIPEKFIQNLRYLNHLEFLEITDTHASQFPESIGELIHLHNLILNNNEKLTQLPRSLVHLNKLKILHLDGCKKLEHLPDSSPNPLHISDESYRFSNLRSLWNLRLSSCHALRQIPPSICQLRELRVLDIDHCRLLNELPNQMNELENLHTLRMSNTNIESLPPSLYQLALIKPPGFLRSPWNETVNWMYAALNGQKQPYSVQRDTLRITITHATRAPFAQEHLELLVTELKHKGRLKNPPSRVFVKHENEAGIDAGGLRKDFFYHLLPDCARQMKGDADPILTHKEDFFLLERGITRSDMLLSESIFCLNIGSLLGTLFSGLGGTTCKIGNVFPEHFYYGLLALAIDDQPLIAFKAMNPERQERLCRTLALNDKNGIQDSEGNLLFHLTCLKNDFTLLDPQTPISVLDLYKIWKLINHYEGDEQDETITHKIPLSLIPFLVPDALITTYDMFQNETFLKESFSGGLCNAFREALKQEENQTEVLYALEKYMFETYSRQCEPLVAVTLGFQSSVSLNTLYDKLLNTDDPLVASLSHDPLLEFGPVLANCIQGPRFTRENFNLLIRRSVVDASIDIGEALRDIVGVIGNWYLSNAATDDQSKKMLRCINGTDVITADMPPLEFREPSMRSNGTADPYTRFHTCFSQVDLGRELLDQEITTLEGRNQLITIWLRHIDAAFEGGFSLQ